MTPEERNILAGEYVLGTLAADERAAVKRALGTDPALAQAVAEWERQLGPLSAGAPAVTPPAGAWAKIAAEIRSRPAGGAEIIQLRRRVTFWRGATVVAGALAACLAVAFVAWPVLTPLDRGTHYVAVVDRGGELPALIVNVDTRDGMVSVRSLAAEAPAEKSYEAWYIGEGQKPRSLGTVDRKGMVVNVSMKSIPDFKPENAVFAVTMEPQGGSPSGNPTGPVVYSGKLIPTDQ